MGVGGPKGWWAVSGGTLDAEASSRGGGKRKAGHQRFCGHQLLCSIRIFLVPDLKKEEEEKEGRAPFLPQPGRGASAFTGGVGGTAPGFPAHRRL